jgi:dTDP-4-dehydrorhamnose reductase
LNRDALELWGGPECTVNRVGDHFADQLCLSGHDQREQDLDLLLGRGIRAIRYPLLWERIAPQDPGVRDWRWTDRRLHKLRTLGIRVIAGLVHHGSGPRYTSLIADDFAIGLAEHASAAAERYPWLEDWTPVNEPLTTARFSALYGLWYPHRRSEQDFWLALLNQVDATRLAMRAIRRVTPAARLIQTDDLGLTHATAAMRDQAAFDNVRRWMGWDLLCGRVSKEHPFWDRLSDFGLGDRLRTIADDPCPPDIIGVNHYLTSDRFLDHRIRRYPAQAVGTNGTRAYVDVEAVRVLQPYISGFAGSLREAWDRYHIPLAITEVHNGCTRDEQMRWANDAWGTALSLRTEHIEIVAVTAWSLFGSQGWDTLLTGGGKHECGVFDARGGEARPTAVANLIGQWSHGSNERHPVLAGRGWWDRDIRLIHPAVPKAAPIREHARAWHRTGQPSPPLLIAGATGPLGRAFASACALRDLPHVISSCSDIVLGDTAGIARALDRSKPWAVINTAGWGHGDPSEEASDACFHTNPRHAEVLAAACAERGIPTVHFSSDLCFDGLKGIAHLEDDMPRFLDVSGKSKAAIESRLVDMPGTHLIVRSAAFFSPFDVHNFAYAVVDALRNGRIFAAAEDAIVRPTYVPHLCHTVLDLLIDGETGLWHLSNGEAVSWADFARRIASAVGLDDALVRPVPSSTLGRRAPRPFRVPQGIRHGALLPPLSEAIDDFSRIIGYPGAAEAPAEGAGCPWSM